MPPLTEETLEAVAARFKVLSEPTRLRILRSLREEEKSVGTLAEQLGTSQANVSRHLALLRRHRIVARRKEGPSRLYRIADASIWRLCDLVCGRLLDEVEDQRRALAEED